MDNTKEMHGKMREIRADRHSLAEAKAKRTGHYTITTSEDHGFESDFGETLIEQLEDALEEVLQTLRSLGYNIRIDETVVIDSLQPFSSDPDTMNPKFIATMLLSIACDLDLKIKKLKSGEEDVELSSHMFSLGRQVEKWLNMIFNKNTASEFRRKGGQQDASLKKRLDKEPVYQKILETYREKRKNGCNHKKAMIQALDEGEVKMWEPPERQKRKRERLRKDFHEYCEKMEIKLE